MSREAKIVADAGSTVIIGSAACQGVDRGVAVLSFGLCGSLDPDLKAGDVVVNGDREWIERLISVLPRARRGLIASAANPVATTVEKTRLRAETNADVVDMESDAARDLAERLGAPFAAIRAVSDPAHRSLPQSAVAGFQRDGQVDVAAVLLALARRPWELPPLIRAAFEANRAFAALRNARDLLGPGLGCPYLVQHPVDVV